MAVKANKARAKPAAKNKKSSSARKLAEPVNDDKWRIECDARTLKDAMQIQSDPKRMQAAQAYCDKEAQALVQVSKLKAK